MDKYRSFCVTVRPLNGVAAGSLLENEIMTYLKKKVPYYFICSELENDARHLHIQLWFENPITRGQCVTAFDRILQRTIDYDMNQKKVQHKGVKIAYSDWYSSYLDSNESKIECNILDEVLPENSLDYYPTELEQENLLNKCNAIDKKYHILSCELLEFCKKHNLSLSLYTTAYFLNEYMFILKKMCVVSEKRKKMELASNLYYYTKETYSSYGEFLSKEQEERIELDIEGGVIDRIRL